MLYNPWTSHWSWTWIPCSLCYLGYIGWVRFFFPRWMSKANYGTNSSGTGSFPNVITVNIIVQMNVNSSTIIVQVEYCVYTVTQPALSLSRVWCCSQPTTFCIFISYSQWTLSYIRSCRTKIHPGLITQDRNNVNNSPKVRAQLSNKNGFNCCLCVSYISVTWTNATF